VSSSIRGAMCGYGVFHASPWGFRSLPQRASPRSPPVSSRSSMPLMRAFATSLLVRPLAIATLLLAPIGGCRSRPRARVRARPRPVRGRVVLLRAARLRRVRRRGPGGPRLRGEVFATAGATLAIAVSIVLALVAIRRTRVPTVIAAALASLIALPFALAAAVLEVAPHVFEVSAARVPVLPPAPERLRHRLPALRRHFCSQPCWALGAGLGALLARTDASRAALNDFARDRFLREAIAWSAALLIGAMPVVRYAILTSGASLFP